MSEHTSFATVQLAGGFGNQMFQTAFGFWVAKKLNKEFLMSSLKMHSNTFTHSKKLYFAPNEILQNISFSKQVRNQKEINEKDKLHPYDESFFDQLYKQHSKHNVLFHGYFQNYAYILDEFIQNLKLKHVSKLSNVAFLHIRGGDYKTFLIGKQDLDFIQNYYTKSILLFPSNTEFEIFTNDMDYSLEYIQIQKIIEKVNNEHNKKYTFKLIYNCEEMTAFENMISCPLGGIIINSTFSWWAAYIGNFFAENDKIFSIPQPWFVDASQYQEGFYANFFTVIDGNRANV